MNKNALNATTWCRDLKLRIQPLMVLCVGLLAFAARPAKAFDVTPISYEIDAERGESYVGTIQVTGGADEESVAVYVSDWDRLPNGDRVDNAPGKLPRSCGTWLSVSPSQFTVSTKNNVQVRYSFTVPESATGSYWTYIMLEGVPRAMPPLKRSGKNPGVGITATMRYAVRIVVNLNEEQNVLGKINQVEILASPESDPAQSEGLMARFLFENAGNTFINARYYLELRSLNGETLYRSEIKEFYAFPASEYWVGLPVEQDIPEGKYLALFVVDYGGSARIASETRFTVTRTGNRGGAQ